jgi:spermidine synthase
MPLELSPSEGFYDEYIRDGWFTEKEALWPGQRMSIEIDEILEVGKSLFQDILVFKSKTYGIVLVLDGVIQVTERDEFSYQEMIAHLPLFAHPNPKKVLIVGGGDGGVLREVAKHAGVETIHMCEIDIAVVEAGKKYFPTTLATSFNDPRLTLMINDACAFLKNEGAGQDYDVIICDSSDPVGPAEMLFEAEFFRNMKGK